MVAYVFTNDGLPIFDTIFLSHNSEVQTVDHIGNVATITTDYGLPNDRASPEREINQPSMPILVYALIYFVTYQVVRNPQAPTTTPKLAHIPGCINLKIIDLRNQGRQGALSKKQGHYIKKVRASLHLPVSSFLYFSDYLLVM